MKKHLISQILISAGFRVAKVHTKPAGNTRTTSTVTGSLFGSIEAATSFKNKIGQDSPRRRIRLPDTTKLAFESTVFPNLGSTLASLAKDSQISAFGSNPFTVQVHPNLSEAKKENKKLSGLFELCPATTTSTEVFGSFAIHQTGSAKALEGNSSSNFL